MQKYFWREKKTPFSGDLFWPGAPLMNSGGKKPLHISGVGEYDQLTCGGSGRLFEMALTRGWGRGWKLGWAITRTFFLT